LDRLTSERVRAAVVGRSIERLLADAGVRTVHLGLVDASGTLREKRLGPAAAARAFEAGWSFIDAIQWWGPDDRLTEGFGAASGDAAVEPDSARPYPFAEDGALFLAEFAGPLRELSPRFQLQRMIDLAAASNVDARVGWEFECIVLDPVAGAAGGPGALAPVMTSNRCWSALTMATQEEELDALVRTLEAGAVPVDHVCAELGPGCLEIATAPEPALRSADSALLSKLYTKAHFARTGRQATFMAQLGPGFPGLGGHPSMSLHTMSDGTSLLCDGPGTLSKVGSWAIAGVVTLLPELLAMAAPSPNSFRRFGPGNWAPATATWGPDAYSCALRVVLRDPRTARLELRVPGADTSPHHCLAMFLGAALWGIEERLDLPRPVIPPDDGRAAGTFALPDTLTEAAERFSVSTAARELFGPDFVAHCARARRAEVEACHRFVSAEERDRYLDQV
jgi:glutamine synthetase